MPRDRTTPVFTTGLFSRAGADEQKCLARARQAVDGVLGLSAAHRAELPMAVRDLSRLLTEERSGLARPYWASPRLLAAYLSYFLPWNLYRLSRLLPGLELALAPGARILDLGSGPLTLPLALWCARPDLRAVPLHFFCADIAAKPMRLGKQALERLAGPGFCWDVTLIKAPLDKALGQHRGKNLALVLAGNVLNESAGRRQGRHGGSLAGDLGDFVRTAAGALTPGGRMLLVEPGTRLGGKLITLCREQALAIGCKPLSPCTHDAACPLAPSKTVPGAGRAHDAGLSRRSDSPGRPPAAWCHFTHHTPDASDPAAAPLLRLSRRAGLDKTHLSFSFVYLQRPLGADACCGAVPAARPDQKSIDMEALQDDWDDLEALYRETHGLPKEATAHISSGRDPGAAKAPHVATYRARILSGPIVLPGHGEPARYACCAPGLALVRDTAGYASGAMVLVREDEGGLKDGKSGALLADVVPGQQKTGEKRSGKRQEQEDGPKPDKPRSDRPKLDRPKPVRQETDKKRPGTQKKNAAGRETRRSPDRPARARVPDKRRKKL